MNRLLVVEDEPRIAQFLVKGLRAAGFDTSVVDNGPEAVARATDDQVDLMVLDLGLPGLDGMQVIEQVRRRGHRLPVLVLTARSGVADRVLGLEAGADDYLTKPFAFNELLARVRARLRAPGVRGRDTALQAGPVVVDLLSHTVTLDGSPVDLTAREFALLSILLRHPRQALSREQLLSAVWGYDYDPGSNVVDVYVGYLRRKLGPGVISTVRGVGYRLEAPAG